MAMDKVGVSVSEMQRLLGIGCYETAWMMAHKVRKAMAERDEQYSLAGLVEMDESFLAQPAQSKAEAVNTRVLFCVQFLFTTTRRARRNQDLPI